MAKVKVGIYGASGYLGAELLRRLLLHPGVEVVQVAANDHLGEAIARAHPHLEGMSELKFEKVPSHPPREIELLFLALPHQVSATLVKELEHTETRIIDTSGAFRAVNAEVYERYQGVSHPAPELLSRFVYGLPEVNRERIRGARYVASPGCFATTIELGLLPVARAGLLNGAIDVVAITGSSGAGKTPTETTHHPARAGNVRAYSPLMHPQTPEVTELLRAAGARDPVVHFVPLAGPFVRGIFATSLVRLSGLPADEGAARELIAESYFGCFEGEKFVRRPRHRLPEVVAVAGSNYCEVGFALGPLETSEVRVVSCFSALDNLVKGGAGQAVQNMNVMLGFAEDTTLADPGGYP